MGRAGPRRCLGWAGGGGGGGGCCALCSPRSAPPAPLSSEVSVTLSFVKKKKNTIHKTIPIKPTWITSEQCEPFANIIYVLYFKAKSVLIPERWLKLTLLVCIHTFHPRGVHSASADLRWGAGTKLSGDSGAEHASQLKQGPRDSDKVHNEPEVSGRLFRKAR